jgi:hypothetical protein
VVLDVEAVCLGKWADTDRNAGVAVFYAVSVEVLEDVLQSVRRRAGT